MPPPLPPPLHSGTHPAIRLAPRLTDWTLALCVGIAFATGLAGNLTGRSGDQWVFVLHGIAGFALVLFVVPKLRRVLPRLLHRSRWDRATAFGLAATVAVLLVVGTGNAWAGGAVLDLAGFNLLNWHITLGFALVTVVSAHMIARAKPLRRRDLSGRRQALRWLGIVGLGAAVGPVQAAGGASTHRFTGSRPLGMNPDGTPNTDWPPTSWVADAPRPLDPATWRLVVTGHVVTPLALSFDDLAALTARTAVVDEYAATLDCTGGFATTQQWRGTRVGTLLDHAAVRPGAGWVRFRAVTGYRWCLPLTEARDALIATHTVAQGEAVSLSHGHGGPARLVAPGRRGFQWVKWLVAVEVLTAPDLAEALAIHTSSFTPTGRGE